MTNDPREALEPCPFCGGEAERVDVPTDLGGDPNAGGSCIQCKRCTASTALHFDRKENLYSSWNDRCGRALTASPGEQEPPPAAVWNEAIEAAINIVKPWPGAEGLAQSEAERAVENIRREFVKALESLRREAPAPEGVAGEPTLAIRLEARPTNGSADWTEIFPAQLNWVAKAGHEVRAIEAPSRPDAGGGVREALDDMIGAFAEGVCWSAEQRAAYEKAVKALSTPPAAAESNASVEARLREETHLDACREKLSALRERERQKMNAASDRAEAAASIGDMTEVSISSTESERHRQAFSALNAAIAEFDKLYEALSSVGDEAKKSEGGPLNWQLSDDAKARIAEIDANRRHAALNAGNIVAGSPTPSDPPDRREIVVRIVREAMLAEPFRIENFSERATRRCEIAGNAADAILAALDAFQAKVKELEVVIAHTEYRSDNCDAENYSLYNRLTAAESRATRAEQERNELQGMLLLCGELGGIWNDETPLAYLRRLIDGLIDAQQERDEAYERAAIAVRRRAFNTPYGWDKGQEVWREACEHVEADIRRLAAGTEKEGE